ncbi:MAG TPA: MerR family transcriptional regulator [Candidatus Hydrogenedentes bacterium]|nr:MerR family transcriptional regulator [Candidatus Hydrogenedentota bacterium]
MNALTIGKVARLAGVGVETVRFYEREGLIDKPPRKTSGYRQYPEDTVLRLRFIRHAKELGFTLREIRELLGLQSDGERACDEVRSLAEAKIANIEEKVAMLERIREVLGELVIACKSNKKTGLCPILRAIESEE